MSTVKSSLLALVLLALLMLFSSVFVVSEGQQALLFRLGEVVTNSEGQAKVFNPGLHFKFPFINSVRLFDTRLQTLDITPSRNDPQARIVTTEKKDVIVDYFVKWRIANLEKFYTSTGGSVLRAENLITPQLDNGLRNEFGKRTIPEVVSGERSDIMQILSKTVDERANALGIVITDVRIKAIDFPNEASESVYKRMASEREQKANSHRYQGRSEAEKIRAEADAQAAILIATANRDAKKLRGEGDAQASKIYADAYQQNTEFFVLYRSLEAYKDAFANKQDVLLLKPDSQFFKYFNSATGDLKSDSKK